MLSAQQAIAERTADLPPPDDLLTAVLETLGVELEWEFAACWRPGDEDLHATATWCARPELRPFAKIVEKTRFAPGEGIPGAAWSSGNVQWVEDLQLDPAAVRAGAAQEVGLRAIVAVPLRSARGPEAVIELGTCDRRPPEPTLIAALGAIGAQLGQYIHRWGTELAAAQRERERHQAILEAALDAVITIDASGRILEFNRAAERMFGWTHDEALGREMAALIVPENLRETHREGLRRASVGGGWGRLLGRRVELTALRRNGEEFPIELTIVRVGSHDPPVFTAFLRDVSSRRAVEERMIRLAYHDRLTGLANRSLLEEHLELALARAARSGDAVAVLFLDLDAFKEINDSRGHVSGDRLLAALAARLAGETRAEDLVARHGGDEFLVLLTDLGDDPRAAAATVAEKLVAAVARPTVLDGETFRVGASIGIALFPDDGRTGTELLAAADAAMYRAKRQGRARYAFAGEEPQRRYAG